MNWSPQPRLSRLEPWDAVSLFRQWPHIPWREPIIVGGRDGAGYGCRICIANRGLKQSEIVSLPQTREAFDTHMREAHP